jgi:hypothetical protein
MAIDDAINTIESNRFRSVYFENYQRVSKKCMRPIKLKQQERKTLLNRCFLSEKTTELFNLSCSRKVIKMFVIF